MKLLGREETEKLFQIEYDIYNSIKNRTDDFKDNERKIKMETEISILEDLKKLPLIRQRSNEWFEARKSRLTASDLYESIKENNLKLAKKKAEVLKDDINYNQIPALKWGVMFEPMALRCYKETHNNIEVFDFGLIEDKNNEHFGASPDGINEMGIMLEIKCPYSRTIIDNNIPDKYYYQIQGQLAVCNLTNCDYIECNFKSVDTEQDFCDHITTFDIKLFGVIAEFFNIYSKEYEYLYSDAKLNAKDACINIRNQVSIKPYINGTLFKKFTYWYITEINVQRVTVDEELWYSCVPKINEFWKKVEECKKLPIEEVKSKKIVFIPDDD